MLRFTALLLLASVAMLGGGVDAWAADAEAAPVETMWPSTPEVPAESEPSEESEEATTGVGTDRDADFADTPRVLVASLWSTASVPPVPPPR